MKSLRACESAADRALKNARAHPKKRTKRMPSDSPISLRYSAPFMTVFDQGPLYGKPALAHDDDAKVKCVPAPGDEAEASAGSGAVVKKYERGKAGW